MRVSEALVLLEGYLKRKSIETSKVDAELLLASVLECKRLEVFLNHDCILSDLQLEQLRKLSIRRGHREPLQYILGEVDFYGQSLKVDPRVLIPRPETEELVYQLHQYLQDKPHKWGLDLGTGSGAISIALLALEETLNMVAVDNSTKALEVAYDNAVANRVQQRLTLMCSSWFEKLGGKHFDFIVSNPPYLSKEELEIAQPEVKMYEPRTALVAKENGISDLKHILWEAKQYLNPGGVVVLETGLNQHETLAGCAKNWGYCEVKSTFDLSHRKRFFWAWVA